MLAYTLACGLVTAAREMTALKLLREIEALNRIPQGGRELQVGQLHQRLRQLRTPVVFVRRAPAPVALQLVRLPEPAPSAAVDCAADAARERRRAAARKGWETRRAAAALSKGR